MHAHTHTVPPPPLTHTKTVSHSHTVTHIQSHPHTVTSLVTHTHPHRYYPVIIIYICQSSYYSFLFVSTFVSCIPVIVINTWMYTHKHTKSYSNFFLICSDLVLNPMPWNNHPGWLGVKQVTSLFMTGYYALITIPTRKCACMVYDTDQCHTHLNSLWCLCVLGGVGGGGCLFVSCFVWVVLVGLCSTWCV